MCLRYYSHSLPILTPWKSFIYCPLYVRVQKEQSDSNTNNPVDEDLACFHSQSAGMSKPLVGTKKTCHTKRGESPHFIEWSIALPIDRLNEN